MLFYLIPPTFNIIRFSPSIIYHTIDFQQIYVSPYFSYFVVGFVLLLIFHPKLLNEYLFHFYYVEHTAWTINKWFMEKSIFFLIHFFPSLFHSLATIMGKFFFVHLNIFLFTFFFFKIYFLSISSNNKILWLSRIFYIFTTANYSKDFIHWLQLSASAFHFFFVFCLSWPHFDEHFKFLFSI